MKLSFLVSHERGLEPINIHYDPLLKFKEEQALQSPWNYFFVGDPGRLITNSSFRIFVTLHKTFLSGEDRQKLVHSFHSHLHRTDLPVPSDQWSNMLPFSYRSRSKRVKKPILSRNRRYWRTDSSGSCCQKENFPSREKRLPNERGTESIENQTYHMLMTR